DHLAALDFERNAVDCGQGAEALDQLFGFYERHFLPPARMQRGEQTAATLLNPILLMPRHAPWERARQPSRCYERKAKLTQHRNAHLRENGWPLVDAADQGPCLRRSSRCDLSTSRDRNRVCLAVASAGTRTRPGVSLPSDCPRRGGSREGMKW